MITIAQACGIVALTMVILFDGAAQAQRAPSDGEVADYSGLHAAVAAGDLALVRKRIAAGANLEARDPAGRTPLHVAAFKSNKPVFRALLAAGADVNAFENSDYDVVTIAAVADDLGILRLALAHGGNPANITSPYEGTALIAAAHLGHVEVVDTLIQARAPLDHINNLGWTALIEAVVLGDGGPDHVETARLLIAAGADQTIADRNGVTPGEHARQRDYRAMMRLFER